MRLMVNRIFRKYVYKYSCIHSTSGLILIDCNVPNSASISLGLIGSIILNFGKRTLTFTFLPIFKKILLVLEFAR